MTRAKFAEIYDILFARYGECECPLAHGSSFQLLVAVLLSAQCRDDRVNVVTAELFRCFPDAAAMAAAPEEEIARIIQPCGLFRNKSRNIAALSRMLAERYGGEVPARMEELVRLPGIGRKSANVVLGNAFGIPGFPVDTHVNRVLNRLGAVKVADPEKIEAAVNRLVAPERWTNFSHLLIQHGRRTCHAGKPDCAHCDLQQRCRFYRTTK